MRCICKNLLSFLTLFSSKVEISNLKSIEKLSFYQIKKEIVNTTKIKIRKGHIMTHHFTVHNTTRNTYIQKMGYLGLSCLVWCRASHISSLNTYLYVCVFECKNKYVKNMQGSSSTAWLCKKVYSLFSSLYFDIYVPTERSCILCIFYFFYFFLLYNTKHTLEGKLDLASIFYTTF